MAKNVGNLKGSTEKKKMQKGGEGGAEIKEKKGEDRRNYKIVKERKVNAHLTLTGKEKGKK